MRRASDNPDFLQCMQRHDRAKFRDGRNWTGRSIDQLEDGGFRDDENARAVSVRDMECSWIHQGCDSRVLRLGQYPADRAIPWEPPIANYGNIVCREFDARQYDAQDKRVAALEGKAPQGRKLYHRRHISGFFDARVYDAADTRGAQD